MSSNRPSRGIDASPNVIGRIHFATEANHFDHGTYHQREAEYHQFMDEMAQLWTPVMDLAEESPLEAISLCRDRLRNPLLSLGRPSITTMEQAIAIAQHHLGRLLFDTHVAEDAPHPDRSQNTEAIDLLRKAKDGYTAHLPSFELDIAQIQDTLISCLQHEGRLVEAAEETRNLVDLRKRIWARAKEDVELTPGDRSSLLRELVRSLGRHSQFAADVNQSVLPLEAVQEALVLLEEHSKLFGTDAPLNVLHINLLIDSSARLADCCHLEESLAEAYKALILSREELQKNSTQPGEKAEVLYGRALGNMSARMVDSSVENFRDLELRYICEEAAKLHHRLARLPFDRTEGIPLDYVPQRGGYALSSLSILAATTTGTEQQQALLERSLEVMLLVSSPEIADTLRKFSHVPLSVAYKYYVETLDWPIMGFADANDALRIITGLVHIRLEHAKETGSLDGDVSGILQAELRRGVQLATILQQAAVNEGTKKEASVNMSKVLSQRGVFERFSSVETARVTWMEAKALLEMSANMQPTTFDAVEKNRVTILEEITEYLAMDD